MVQPTQIIVYLINLPATTQPILFLTMQNNAKRLLLSLMPTSLVDKLIRH